jgi:8-oxo-dGTP pyrophosphatase MutT (NUDIX family)
MTDETNDPPIPAATIILLRDEPAFEVLMIERHVKIGFAGGALVFPGGRIDPADAATDWKEHATGLDPRFPSAQIAAIREAFEEAGILLAREAEGDAIINDARAASLHRWRKRVEDDARLFLAMIREERLTLACDSLTLFSHWVAPPGLHRRFDTLFFATTCPHEQTAREDGGEATEVLWIAPQAALDARARDERRIIFPTARNVELLGVSKSAKEVFDSARRREIRPVQPEVKTRDGVSYLTIPEGLGYPVTEEPLFSAIRG